jgi:hypothetical protein
MYKRRWLCLMLIGLVCGIFIIAGDILFAPYNDFADFTSCLSISILASISAGLEKKSFRMFVFGPGADPKLAAQNFNGRTVALWIANIIPRHFGAGHLERSWLMAPSSRTESCIVG